MKSYSIEELENDVMKSKTHNQNMRDMLHYAGWVIWLSLFMTFAMAGYIYWYEANLNEVHHEHQ